MAELYSLPNGWEWKKLDDITELITKGTTPTTNGYKFQNSGINFLKIENIVNGEIDLSTIEMFISEEAHQSQKRSQLQENDVLFSIAGTIGDTAIVKKEHLPMNINQAIALIRPKNILNTFFLKYSLLSIISQNTKDKQRGGAIKNISLGDIKDLNYPLPPLEEQKRIVAKLDILFAKIDKVIALHQKNIDEADIFMASVLNDVFVELEEKYGLDNIGNMIDILTDYHSNGAYKDLKTNVELLDEEDYALMIRATDLENGDYTNNVKYITESAYNFMSKSKVFGGEIILPKIGTIGNVYFMPYLERPVSLAMNLFMLRCSDKVMNKYMFLFLKSPRGNENILNKANGAVTKTITKDAVRSIELPFPPLKTQQKVVAYLDEISQKMEKIKQIQKEKMQSLKALKASILDQAFKGEL